MEDFIRDLPTQAAGLGPGVLKSFFATVRHQLAESLAGIDDVEEEGVIRMDDLRLRVVSQLLAYNYDYKLWDSENSVDEIPETGYVIKNWRDELADYMNKVIEPNANRASIFNQKFETFLEPPMGTLHKCYHCHSVFEREVVVEVDPVSRDFIYSASAVVSWENERLAFKGLSALDEFEEFANIPHADQNEECPICIIGDAHVADGMKKTTCGHAYGSSCLRVWMESNNNCPKCRFEFLADAHGASTTLLRTSREIRRNNPN